MAIQHLADKLVLVTGAGSGIGFEIARHFAAQGAKLLLVDINDVILEVARQKICTTGADCHIYRVDVSDPEAMHDLSVRVQAEHGVLDVLVNNAGIAFLGSFRATPLAQWRRTLDINVMGVVHGCHYFLPDMLKAGGARHIVNIASAAGLAATANMSAYSASKHAIVGLSDCLALELSGSSVAISVVCPGVINTPIAQFSGSNVGKNISVEQVARLGEYYRIQGAAPSVVGAAVVDAVRTGKSLVLVGPFAALIYHLRRLSRTLLHKILVKESKKMGWL